MHIVMHSQVDTKVSEGGDVCEGKKRSERKHGGYHMNFKQTPEL